MNRKRVLQEYFKDGFPKLEHENKKLKWSVSPDGFYLFSNNSTVRPICYKFNPKARVVRIETDTKIGNFVYVCSTNSRKFTFTVVE